MALATYNGDVVIPHRPDWRQRVAWSRAWDTSIESGLTGAEDRRAMRLKPRERVVFRVIPWNAEERIRLLERLKAGVKAGRVLVPNWGRGATLAAEASGVLDDRRPEQPAPLDRLAGALSRYRDDPHRGRLVVDDADCHLVGDDPADQRAGEYSDEDAEQHTHTNAHLRKPDICHLYYSPFSAHLRVL